MKKKSLFAIFISKFIRTLLVLLLLVAVGFSSYKITQYYYKITDADSSIKSDSAIKDLVNDSNVEEISRNLLYSMDEDDGTINHMVLEIFNTNTGNLDYITIPIKTNLTISNELYKKLYAANKDVPQIVTLDRLTEYFDSDSVCAYGVIILEDLLDVDINYYTEVPESLYETFFETREREISYNNNVNTESSDNTTGETDSAQDSDTSSNDNTAGAVEVEVLTDSIREEISNLTSVEDWESFIKDNYENINSNLSVKNKLKYAEDYKNANFDYVYYHRLYGEMTEDSFTVDVDSSNQLIDKILNNESYTEEQKEDAIENSQAVTSSIGLNIQILNGSNISGLAAKFKEKLTLSGYTITGIGNYEEDSILTNTEIIVRTENTGLDLLENFNDAKIQVGDLPDGIDIRIILGTNDNIMR